jgi:hypothetical protein
MIRGYMPLNNQKQIMAAAAVHQHQETEDQLEGN